MWIKQYSKWENDSISERLIGDQNENRLFIPAQGIQESFRERA